MREIEVKTGKSVEFGFPVTPSKWLGDVRKKKISRVLMTCGGGMGGSRWYEYVQPLTRLLHNFDSLVSANRIDGKNVAINPRYIVQVEDFIMVESDFITENPNYNDKVRTVRFLVEPRTFVDRTNEFDKECKGWF